MDAVRLGLLRDQVLSCDRDLLPLRITGQLDDLESVLKRQRDRVLLIRGRDEHDITQIVIEIEIMVIERLILFRIEHLEQRTGRVAAEVHRHLVDLVEQEHGILRADLLERLDQLAGQRADIRAAMAANLGFVAHAPERLPHELATGRVRDRSRERRLADARRPDETQDRSALARHERLHGEILEDALLHLVQAVVLGLEDALGFEDVVAILGLVFPR